MSTEPESPQGPSSGSSRVAIIAAVVSVFVLGVVGFRIAVQRDRIEGQPNSVSNCDTPPALR